MFILLFALAAPAPKTPEKTSNAQFNATDQYHFKLSLGTEGAIRIFTPSKVITAHLEVGFFILEHLELKLGSTLFTSGTSTLTHVATPYIGSSYYLDILENLKIDLGLNLYFEINSSFNFGVMSFTQIHYFLLPNLSIGPTVTVLIPFISGFDLYPKWKFLNVQIYF